MKIIYLNYHKKQITGGHRYNDAFLAYLSKISGTEITKIPNCSAIYATWLKPLAPLLELRRMRLFSHNCITIWGDTSYLYHFLLALLVKLVFHVKSIIIIHHFQYNIESEKSIRSAVYYYYLKSMGTIIAPSPYTLSLAKKFFPRKQLFYIPLPFEKEFCLSKRYQVGNFLYVGTVEARKGLLYLIEALGLVKQHRQEMNISLNIVGEIIEKKYADLIMKRAQELNLVDCIMLRGYVSAKELDNYYQRAEIFTFPSLLEGYGIVLIEAFSRGVPVVCFNNSAMPYTIKDGINGLVADNMNVKSLAEKILLLSGNKTLREKLQKGIVKTIEGLKTKEDFEAGIRNMFHTVKQTIG